MRQKDFSEIGTRWRWLFWETLIIVLGVLIAFAVNDYWSDRLDRELEIQYLKRHHADIKTDEAWTTNYNQGPIITKMAALDAIAPVVRGREPVPAELRNDFNVEVVEEFGVEHALEKIKSHEFQDLVNQEYNFGYFITRIYEVYAGRSSEMAAELQAHIEELEGQ